MFTKDNFIRMGTTDRLQMTIQKDHVNKLQNALGTKNFGKKNRLIIQDELAKYNLSILQMKKNDINADKKNTQQTIKEMKTEPGKMLKIQLTKDYWNNF